jgi:hypothetical protein
MEQTKAVLKMKAIRRFNPAALRVMSEEEEFALKEHFNEAYAIIKDNDFTYLNPYSEFVVDSIPPTFVQARTAVDHYFDMTAAISKFYLPTGWRYIIDNNVMMTLEDNWQCHRIYGEAFIYDVMQMPPQGRFVIKALREASRPLTLPDIQSIMRNNGVTVKLSILKEIVERMVSAGYIFADATFKSAGYVLSPIVIEFEKKIDWKTAFTFAKERMKEIYPEAYGEWLKTERVETTDPITGARVNMLEWQPSTPTLPELPKEKQKNGSLIEYLNEESDK